MTFNKNIPFTAFLLLLFCGCNTFEWNLKKKPEIIVFNIDSIANESFSFKYKVESINSALQNLKYSVYTDTTSSHILSYELNSLEGTQTISSLTSNTEYFIQLECKNEVGFGYSVFKSVVTNTTQTGQDTPTVQTNQTTNITT